MSGGEPGGWTIETLKDYLTALIQENDRRYEQRFSSAQLAVNAALAAAKEAVTKAEIASEKRFEGVNEFRNALGDQQRTLMPRAESELRFSNLEAKIDTLEAANIKRSGIQTGGREMWAYIIAALMALLAVLSFVLTRIG